MLDLNKFITTGEDGKTTVDNEAYKKALTSYVDSKVNSGIETFKTGSFRNEIKKELEAEAKLSAEELLQKERDSFEAYKKEQKAEIVKSKASAVLKNGGFSDDEAKEYLKLVTDDEESSLKTMERMVELRNSLIEETKKNAIKGIQSNEPEIAKASVTIKSGSDKDKEEKPTRYTIQDIEKKYKD